MKQFLLPPSYEGGGQILLDKDDSHYLLNVRRSKVGDVIPGRDSKGNVYSLTILGIKEDRCIIEPLLVDTAPDSTKSIELILMPCLLKGKKMDGVIRQAVESGASQIHPLESRNTIVKLKEDRQKGDRWRKIVKEAAQQSGSTQAPELMDPTPLKQLPPLKKGELGLYFHEKALEINHLHGYLDGQCHKIRIIVGPEGGISPEESQFLDQLGYNPVYLGKNILRAETAAIYGLGAVQTILREKEQWIMKRPSKG